MICTFSSNFIKTSCRGFSFVSISKSLLDYSKRFDIELDECYYAYVSKIIDEGLYFQLEKEDIDEVLYIAIHWASLESFRSATKKTKAKHVKLPRVINYYTRLQRKIISLIYSSFEGHERDKYIEFYLNLFFELNCVQRKRKSK